MKITTFNPLIVTKDASATIALFEALGFHRRHSIDAKAGTQDFTSVRMKTRTDFMWISQRFRKHRFHRI